MGFSFQYKGKLKSLDLLDELVNEVEDICETLGWKSKILDNKTANKESFAQGIVFNPPDCEPLYFIFDENGQLTNPFLKDMITRQGAGDIKIITIKLDLNDENPIPQITENEESFDPTEIINVISVQTHFNEDTDHIKVLELIRYISKKYLLDFTLHDESTYWESGIIKDSDNKNELFLQLLEDFQKQLHSEEINSPEDFMSFLKKLAERLISKE